MSHCQICAREIKSNTGTIAHHGFLRPGNGWGQTSSCEGAKYLPYEQSRDRIPEVVENYKKYRQNNIEAETDYMANPPATITRFAMSSYGKNETFVRPENFDSKKAMEKGSWGFGEGYWMEFSKRVRECQKNIKSLDAEIEFLKLRWLTWKKVA